MIKLPKIRFRKIIISNWDIYESHCKKWRIYQSFDKEYWIIYTLSANGDLYQQCYSPACPTLHDAIMEINNIYEKQRNV